MPQRFKKKKYKGYMFRSEREYEDAKFLTKNKVDWSYESCTLSYVVPEITKRYYCDFIVTTKSGRILYIERKGRFPRPGRFKFEKILEANPNIDIRIVFQKDNLLQKGAKSRYSDWCKKRNIRYAVGEIPKEWLDE